MLNIFKLRGEAEREEVSTCCLGGVEMMQVWRVATRPPLAVACTAEGETLNVLGKRRVTRGWRYVLADIRFRKSEGKVMDMRAGMGVGGLGL